MKNDIKTVSERELDVLNILWNNDKPLIASDIIKIEPSLSINTVHSVLRSLLKKGLIEIAEIVYSGTVLTRNYRALVDFQELENIEMKRIFNNFRQNDISIPRIVATLLEHEKNEEVVIEELELLLDERKKNLKEKRE